MNPNNDSPFAEINLSNYEKFLNKSWVAGTENLEGREYLEKILSNMSHNLKAFVWQVHAFFSDCVMHNNSKLLNNKKIIHKINKEFEDLEKKINNQIIKNNIFKSKIVIKDLKQTAKRIENILNSMNSAGIPEDQIKRLSDKLNIFSGRLENATKNLKNLKKKDITEVLISNPPEEVVIHKEMPTKEIISSVLSATAEKESEFQSTIIDSISEISNSKLTEEVVVHKETSAKEITPTVLSTVENKSELQSTIIDSSSTVKQKKKKIKEVSNLKLSEEAVIHKKISTKEITPSVLSTVENKSELQKTSKAIAPSDNEQISCTQKEAILSEFNIRYATPFSNKLKILISSLSNNPNFIKQTKTENQIFNNLKELDFFKELDSVDTFKADNELIDTLALHCIVADGLLNKVIDAAINAKLASLKPSINDSLDIMDKFDVQIIFHEEFSDLMKCFNEAKEALNAMKIGIKSYYHPDDIISTNPDFFTSDSYLHFFDSDYIKSIRAFVFSLKGLIFNFFDNEELIAKLKETQFDALGFSYVFESDDLIKLREFRGFISDEKKFNNGGYFDAYSFSKDHYIKDYYTCFKIILNTMAKAGFGKIKIEHERDWNYEDFVHNKIKMIFNEKYANSELAKLFELTINAFNNIPYGNEKMNNERKNKTEEIIATLIEEKKLMIFFEKEIIKRFSE